RRRVSRRSKRPPALAGRYVSICWAKATKVRRSASAGPIRPRCLTCPWVSFTVCYCHTDNFMRTVQKSLRVPVDVAQAVQETAEATGRDFSTMVNELLTEAVKMRRCPGILFAEGPSGRRARIAGTGVEVWEIIATYRSVNRTLRRLQRAYDWLAEPQLRAALGYYAAYP